jgi:hypothetical protein
MNHWLSYGGGVNSTALAIMLCDGRLPQYAPFRVVWADTKDEKDETYDYVFNVIQPYLRRHGVTLEIVCDSVGVIERWERTNFVGSRKFRSCTDHAKIQPIKRHLAAHGTPADIQIIGIDAGERHRAKERDGIVFPLVEMELDRNDCAKIIEAAGLPLPVKSGCWHCPFMRVSEILELATKHPQRMRRVIALEMAANKDGRKTHQWNDTPAIDYAKRACAKESSGPLFQEVEPDQPCACYDG